MKAKLVVPILRMFDEAKAREFYIDYLGFKVAFEHRFEPEAPLYMGVSIDGVEIHLSEHHGDAAPGATLRIEMADVNAYHEQLTAKHYKYARPGIQDQEWGLREVAIADPFGNKLIFCEPLETLQETREQRPS